MTQVTPSRNTIQTEETDFRSAVSESILQKMGATSNFINFFQMKSHQFHANGRYADVLRTIGVFPRTNFDGIFVAPFDAEIMGHYIFNGTKGTGSSTVLDIHKLTGGDTDAGTVFSAKPTIASAAVSGAYDLKIFDASAGSTITKFSTAGITMGTFTTLPFSLDQGEALRCDIDSVMDGDAQDISIILFFRPR